MNCLVEITLARGLEIKKDDKNKELFIEKAEKLYVGMP